jgi:ABC-2 type transport system ATP-binding protein
VITVPSAPVLLAVRNLVRRFGGCTAVDGVSFEVRVGESVGLLGPNGAGKTTTFSMITGLLRPDSGELLLGGAALVSDTDPIKRRLGLVPQDLALYEELAARRNLGFFAAIQGVERSRIPEAVRSALEFVGLADRADDRVGTFSGGMKRRLNLAAALLHDPEILLLDEPTVGVDPQSRNAIFDNIAELRRRGKTLLYTTHYMEEVERLCDRVIVIDRGRIVADDSLARLRHRAGAGAGAELRIELEELAPAGLLGTFRDIPGIGSVRIDGRSVQVRVESLAAGSSEVLRRLAEAGIGVRSFSAEPPNLEAVFLELTGRSLRDS